MSVNSGLTAEQETGGIVYSYIVVHLVHSNDIRETAEVVRGLPR